MSRVLFGAGAAGGLMQAVLDEPGLRKLFQDGPSLEPKRWRWRRQRNSSMSRPRN
jgi:hypothetical protein